MMAVGRSAPTLQSLLARGVSDACPAIIWLSSGRRKPQKVPQPRFSCKAGRVALLARSAVVSAAVTSEQSGDFARAAVREWLSVGCTQDDQWLAAAVQPDRCEIERTEQTRCIGCPGASVARHARAAALHQRRRER